MLICGSQTYIDSKNDLRGLFRVTTAMSGDVHVSLGNEDVIFRHGLFSEDVLMSYM